jgi:hypothetical protein
MLEEEPLGPRQLDQLAATPDHPPLEVDLDVVEGDDAGSRLDAGRASDDGSDAGRELVGVEGLGDVVVGTEVETLRLVGRCALGRQQDDRDRSLLAELSRRTISGRISSALARASSPPLAVTTRNPSSLSAMETSFVIRGSSSATRTRG